MAMLPAELKYVPDDFLHQAEGLLDLGPNQRSEVHYSHVHLHTDTDGRKHRQMNLTSSDISVLIGM